MKKQVYLGVNIDHVATLREARKTVYPSILDAAKIVEQSGAHNITLHLREDRRHIQTEDMYAVKENCSLPLNFEMALSEEIMSIALDICPEEVCIVPERREELTTEGGLDIQSCQKLLSEFIEKAHMKRIKVSIFVNPDKNNIALARAIGADIVELHTGAFAEENNSVNQKTLYTQLLVAARYAHELGLQVNAGHGLHYMNISDIISIQELHTVNIGHAIVARSIFVGLDVAIREMLELLET